jgi:transcriptional regulator with XRE-family HTH domain
MQYHEQFGERIRRRRMALGMIQKTLAEQLNLPQGVISRLEHGEFVSVRIDTLVRLANLLQCSTDFLLGRTDDPRPPRRQRKRVAEEEDDEVESALEESLYV